MTQTAFNWIFTALLVAILVLWGLDSCNRQPVPAVDNAKQDSLIGILLHKADSVLSGQRKLDSSIARRDSLKLQNDLSTKIIYITRDEKNKTIINNPLTPKRVDDINHFLDSLFKSTSR